MRQNPRRSTCVGEIEASAFGIEKIGRDPGNTYSQGNYGMPSWDSDLTSTEKLERDRNENSASSSQVWHRNENPSSKPREIEARCHLEMEARSKESTHRETRLTHHKQKIYKRQYLEKVFSNAQKKMNWTVCEKEAEAWIHQSEAERHCAALLVRARTLRLSGGVPARVFFWSELRVGFQSYNPCC